MKKLFDNKILRGIAVFAAAVIVLQTAALLLFSTGGVRTLYPVALTLASDKINTEDSLVGEYHKIQDEIEKASLIVLSVDPGVDDSYVLASDLFEFVRRYVKISNVAVYYTSAAMANVSEKLEKGDRHSVRSIIDTLDNYTYIPTRFMSFLGVLCDVENKTAPDAKFGLVGVSGMSSYSAFLSSFTSELILSGIPMNDEITPLLNPASEEEFIAAFRTASDTLSVSLGDKFAKYSAMVDALEKGELAGYTAADNLSHLAPAGNGTVFAVLPREAAQNGTFEEYTRETYGDVLILDTVYSGCRSYDGKTVTSVNDVSLPLVPAGIRIAPAGSLEAFRKYTDGVTHGGDATAKLIGDAGEKTFFVINKSISADPSVKNDAEDDE